MTRSELITHVAETLPGFRYAQIQKAILSNFLRKLVCSVDEGKRVELRDLDFSLRHKKPRLGRNPKTGEVVTIPAKRKLFFRTGKDLRDKIIQPPKA